MLTRRSAGHVIAGAVAVSLFATGAVASTDSALETGVAPIQIDFGDLEQGRQLTLPWFADGAFHRYNVSWDAETDPMVAFIATYDGSPAGPTTRWVGLTDPADDDLHLVKYELDNDGKVVSELVRQGDLSHLVATADGRYFAYARDGADVFLSTPSGGQLLSGKDAHPAGFSDGLLVINETYDGEPSVHLYDYLCDDDFEPETCRTSRIDGVLGVTTTSDPTGLIAVTGEDEEGEWYSAILDTSHDNREVWRSNERRIESFSPNGAYAATVDIRSDGLGHTDVEIIGAWSGETLLRAEMEVSQRLAWEPATTISPGNQLVFDAWDDGEQALVRCDVSTGCELATTPVPADDPVELPPHLLVTQ
ncbi:hypothetical protein [Phytoactinopolyspora mesophila]|uniref:WD40 repeat domain-containing protein n=1 Tax=Phytoactinopolyspora mesophila TaxID=2650750 RepID=A0A7K3MDK7_9ACTN|nr:hypothetical protein [Phytoactinopolyspora mesophila]NDL60488.1 hypothetical protein [Phytoactinopolyspora mesophila]